MSGKACEKGCECGRHKGGYKGHLHSKESRKKMSESGKGREFSEEHRIKLGESNKRRISPKGWHHSEEYKERSSISKSKFYSDPDNREAQSIKLKEVMSNPEIRKAISERQLLNWQDQEYAHKVLSANGQRPNKAEIRCLERLEKEEPGVWKYVGDGQLIVGGKCPDFWDGGTRLVEMYGDYWHRGQNPQDRINYFKEYGYDCKVIWESEIDE